jgi:hypothetical protein
LGLGQISNKWSEHPPPIPIGQDDAFRVGLGIFISISIAGGSNSADVRELGSASGKKKLLLFLSALSPASERCRAPGLPKTQAVPKNWEAGC